MPGFGVDYCRTPHLLLNGARFSGLRATKTLKIREISRPTSGSLNSDFAETLDLRPFCCGAANGELLWVHSCALNDGPTEHHSRISLQSNGKQ